MSAAPPVSVCIPTYNGAAWIEEAIGSVLRQSYADLEVLVLDDGSRDGTVDIARGVDDPRVTVQVNPRPAGMVANWNECIRRTRGTTVKFVFQDDVLYPDALERQLEVMDRHPGVGLVFSPRDLILDDPGDPAAVRWAREHARLHDGLGALDEVVDGRRIISAALSADPWGNPVGEPTVVLMRRRCLEQLGGFNVFMRQLVDAEMWLRILAFWDAGFVPHPLCAFRVHPASATADNRSGRARFDELWLVEGILAHPQFPRLVHNLARLRRREITRTLWLEARDVLRYPRNRPPRPGVTTYLRYRRLPRERRGRLIHPPVGRGSVPRS